MWAEQAMTVGRDRDDVGRARNARPRDELGRPLPYGAVGTARIPDDLVLDPATTLREAQRLLDRGLPFHAHEVLEGMWKQSAEPERELWQGLAQLAVGLTHVRRGNVRGAITLITRARRRIGAYADRPPSGVDVPGLVDWSDRVLAELGRSTPELGGIAAPRLRLPVAVEEGGEAVCWLAQVCPSCGGLDDHRGDVCPRCGASLAP